MVLYNWRPCLIWQWLEWTKLKVTGGWLAGSTVDRVRSGPGVMTTTHANRRGSSIQVENSGSTTSLSGKLWIQNWTFFSQKCQFFTFSSKKSAGQNDKCVSDIIVTVANVSLPSPGVILVEYEDAPLSPQVTTAICNRFSWNVHLLGAVFGRFFRNWFNVVRLLAPSACDNLKV